MRDLMAGRELDVTRATRQTHIVIPGVRGALDPGNECRGDGGEALRCRVRYSEAL